MGCCCLFQGRQACRSSAAEPRLSHPAVPRSPPHGQQPRLCCFSCSVHPLNCRTAVALVPATRPIRLFPPPCCRRPPSPIVVVSPHACQPACGNAPHPCSAADEASARELLVKWTGLNKLRSVALVTAFGAAVCGTLLVNRPVRS
jgi:hypothetical protein